MAAKKKLLSPVLTRKKFVRRISRGNQVTLPPNFLTKNNLCKGDNVEVIEEDGKVIIQTFEPNDKKKLVEKIQSLFTQMDQVNNQKDFSLDEKSLLSIIDKEIEAVRHNKK